MKYKVVVTELVQHSKLPQWALQLKLQLSQYYKGLTWPDKTECLRLIDREIDRLLFVVRNEEKSGKVINRRIEGDEMTVFSGYKETPLLRISFEENGTA